MIYSLSVKSRGVHPERRPLYAFEISSEILRILMIPKPLLNGQDTYTWMLLKRFEKRLLLNEHPQRRFSCSKQAPDTVLWRCFESKPLQNFSARYPAASLNSVSLLQEGEIWVCFMRDGGTLSASTLAPDSSTGHVAWRWERRRISHFLPYELLWISDIFMKWASKACIEWKTACLPKTYIPCKSRFYAWV